MFCQFMTVSFCAISAVIAMNTAVDPAQAIGKAHVDNYAGMLYSSQIIQLSMVDHDFDCFFINFLLMTTVVTKPIQVPPLRVTLL
jgi:hypothetical protein